MTMPHKSLNLGFNLNTSMDNSMVQSHLNELGSAIDQIYAQNVSTLSYEQLYRKAYNMVMQRKGDALYDGIKKIIQKHLEQSQKRIAQASNDQILPLLNAQWSLHRTAFTLIKGVLLYMDNNYCTKNQKPLIYDALVELFRDVVVYSTDVRQRVQSQVLLMIDQERRCVVIDRQLVKETLLLLQAMGRSGIGHLFQVRDASSSSSSSNGTVVVSTVYIEEFERPFLQATMEFYRSESVMYLSQSTCPEYLLKVERRLGEEMARVGHYLSSSTQRPQMECVETQLLSNHVTQLLSMEGSGLHVLLAQSKLDDLRRMYTLFGRVARCADALREGVYKYIVDTGLQLLHNHDAQKDSSEFVRELLVFRSKFEDINLLSFKGDPQSSKRIWSGFEEFINHDSRCASYLATFMDDLLRSSGLPDSEFDDKIDKIIVIYRCLQDKDIFENFYRCLLSKRLLSGKSSSIEHEQSILTRLKTESGYQFTSKMEGMLRDIQASERVQQEFALSSVQVAARDSSAVDFEVQVLTNGFWPFPTIPNCVLPIQLQECCRRFERFYNQKNGGRRLTWLSQLGSVDVKASFPLGLRELNVSTYQACMLMLFNGRATLSLDEIKGATKITDLELRRHLLSLCTPKMRILNKLSKGKGIDDDDSFTVNRDFVTPKRRMKVPLVAAREAQSSGKSGEDALSADAEKIPADVEMDRRTLIDAAVVRIMKSRKTVSHNDLIAEVTRQLSTRFVPTPLTIKKQIESLIDREYMQRHSEDARIYSYTA